MASSHCRYSALSTLRKLTRHQIMKTWPIFSSTVRLRSAFSAHLSPRVALTGAGRECFLANAGRVSVRARNKARKIRGIGGTIAEEEGIGCSSAYVGTAALGCPSGRRPDASHPYESVGTPSRASLDGQPRAAVPTRAFP